MGAASAPAAAADPVTISITAPENEQTIHDNLGNVPVSVAIGGAAPDGARIRVLLDGRPFGPEQTSTSFTLAEVERGEHTLQVELLDPRGNAIASSGRVTFYMWQASRLFPSRKK